MMGEEFWQPIQSVPIGKVVLLYCPQEGIFTGGKRVNCDDDEPPWVACPYHPKKHFWSYANWIKREWLDDKEGFCPTHWMPLPRAPGGFE